MSARSTQPGIRFDQQLLARVRENQKRLSECAGPHDFQDITPEKTLMKKFRCSKCRGETDFIAKLWYDRGLEHGRKK